MKLRLPKDWFERRIRPDDDTDIGAGLTNPSTANEAESSSSELAQAVAFGTLIQFLRRDRQLSVQELAEAAKVDIAEIVKIEFGSKSIPQSQSVYQLAKYFNLPPAALLEISNAVPSQNHPLREAALRFVANVSKTGDLSLEERATLTEFLKSLNAQPNEKTSAS